MDEKCPDCGGNDFRTATEIHKARCPIQYLIDGSLFCYGCLGPGIKAILDNPTECESCDGTPTCPSSSAAAEATRMNSSHKGKDRDKGKTEAYQLGREAAASGKGGNPWGGTPDNRRWNDYEDGKASISSGKT